MYIDSHAHLTSERLLLEADEVMERAVKASLRAVINICTDLPSLQAGLTLSQRYPQVYNAGATTPHDVEREGEVNFEAFASCARNKKFIAVGETGLDYYYEHSPKEKQKHFLTQYLHLATECNLPVIIHCRDAFQDLFSILDKEYPKGKGILHCFTGTLDEAKEVVNRNFFLSLSGIVTFKKSIQLKEVAKWVPLENLLIETDSPYLAPEKHRGKMNEPAFLPEIAKVIAEIKGLSLEEVAQKTTENAILAFSLNFQG